MIQTPIRFQFLLPSNHMVTFTMNSNDDEKQITANFDRACKEYFVNESIKGGKDYFVNESIKGEKDHSTKESTKDGKMVTNESINSWKEQFSIESINSWKEQFHETLYAAVSIFFIVFSSYNTLSTSYFQQESGIRTPLYTIHPNYPWYYTVMTIIR